MKPRQKALKDLIKFAKKSIMEEKLKHRKFMEKKYHIVTYGCQMNVHESEKIAGILAKLGYRETKETEEADIIVFNTCCIRENAENHAFGNIGALKKLKEEEARADHCRRRMYDSGKGQDGDTQKEIPVYRYHVRNFESRGAGRADRA